MTAFNHRRLATALGLAGLALALAGCNTYGTGTTPAMQTVQDIAGIAALNGEQKEPIDYKSRPKIVPPPDPSALPPPGSEQNTVASADWPKDPDVQYQALKAEVARREKTGEALPQIKLPKQQRTSQEPIVAEIDRSAEAMPKPGESERARKLFADARGAVAVDENGKPVRRYLTDPPSDYRVPDPNAPVEIVDEPAKKKKFKWPWQWFASN